MNLTMEDAIAALLWFAVNLLLIHSAWTVSRHLFPKDSFFPRLMHATLLYCAGVVGSVLVLGVVGLLRAWVLLAVAAALAVVARWRVRSLSAVDGTADSVRGGEPEAGRAPAERIALWLWGAGLAFLMVWTVRYGILRYPSSWDTLTYHLPLVVQWLQCGSLYAPNEANWANPGNNEVLGLWMVAPFSGDFLIALNNLPATVLLAVGTVELAAILGLSVALRHLCGWAAVIAFPVFDQALNAGNDVAVAGLFMVTLAYGVRFIRNGRGPDLGLAGVSLGLLAGVKYYALGYAGIVGLGLVVLAGVVRGPRVAARVLAILLVGAVLWGSYWYVRNVVRTGTPLYPKGFTPATDVTGRIRPDVWQTSILGNRRPEVFPLLSKAVWRLTGPCQWSAAWLLPGVLAWLSVSAWWVGRRSLHRSDRWCRLALAGWLLTAALVWVLTPFAVTAQPGTLDMLKAGFSPVRYGLCFLSLSIVGLGVILDDLSGALRRLSSRSFAGLAQGESKRPEAFPSWAGMVGRVVPYLPLIGAGVAAVYQTGWKMPQYYPYYLVTGSASLGWTVCLGLDLFVAAAVVRWVWRSWPRSRLALVVAFGCALAAGIGERARAWHKDFAAHYDHCFNAGTQFQELAAMDPAAVSVCVADYQYYPFFGSRRQFRASRPLWVFSYPSLLEYLRDHGATLVAALWTPNDIGFAGRYNQTSPWLRQHPERFTLIQDGPCFLVYRVRRDGPDAASATE